jgi:hypothetical protein
MAASGFDVGGLMMTFADKVGGAVVDLGKMGGQMLLMQSLMPKGADMSASAPPAAPPPSKPAAAPAVPSNELSAQAASAPAGWSTGTMIAVGGIAAVVVAGAAIFFATR